MFTVDTGRFLWVVFLSCLIVELGLVYLDLTVNWLEWTELGPIQRLFNTTREDALASFFAVTQTVFVALMAWIIYAISRSQAVPLSRRIGWMVVALIFTYLAIDDGAAVHERLGSAFKEREGGSIDFPSYPWQLLLAPVFGAMGMFLVVFLWLEMPRTADRARLLCAMMCFAIAVAMDFVEGMEDGYRWMIETFHWRNETIRHFSKSIEEFIEMLGMTLLLVTFIGQIALRGQQIVVRFQGHR